MIMWIRALKAARVAAGVSQDGLAEKINWSASTIAAIETGRRKPTFKFAEEADEALETAPPPGSSPGGRSSPRPPASVASS
jgi:transcriptional regulator with XRE-family HTH domain